MSLSAVNTAVGHIFELALTLFNGNFPEKAVAYAVDNQEESTPVLLDYLEHAIKSVDSLDESYMGHIYALFILSQFKEPLAFPWVVELCKLPYEQQEMLLGDSLTEHLAKFLGSTFTGDLSLLKELVESESIHYFARSQVLYSFLVLMNDGVIEAAAVNAYIPILFELFTKKMDREGMTMLISFCLDFNGSVYVEEMKRAFELKLVNEEIVNLKDVIREYSDQEKSKYKAVKHYQSVKNTFEEMSWWACFNEKNFQTGMTEHESRLFEELNPPSHHHGDGCGCGETTTIRYSEPKLGRNDPCHCGSGKKFKKCCLN